MTLWLILRSATRQEPKAIRSLKEAGYNAYCPMRTVWNRMSREKDATKQMPLLPGYLFVERPADELLYGILKCDGVSKFQTITTANGVKLAGVSRPDLDMIAGSEGIGCFDETYKPPRDPLQKGDRVRVVSGAAAGEAGEIVKAKGGRKLKVFLERWGKAVNLTVADVLPVDDVVLEEAA